MKKILLAVAALAVVAVIAWTVTDRNPAPAVQYQALDGPGRQALSSSS